MTKPTPEDMEATLADLREEGDRLRAALAQRDRELEEQKARARAVIHDMKVPLTISLLNLELAQMEDEAEESGNYLNGIRRELELLLTSIGSMLELEKAEAGALQLRPQEFDLRELADRVIARMSVLIADKPDLALENALPEGLPPVSADLNQFTRILDNLFSNAIKYTETGSIRITGEHQSATDRFRVSIADTGQGIEPERLARLFQYFDGDNGQYVSSGVGLALVKRLMEKHRGKVAIASEQGKGTVVTLEFPRGFGEG